ncbi:hypothetical protein QBC37DRAFT_66151 [Rhypophila decipiens]|uniref:Uncharacterized protein n=1 Tax=Rhypophila decipiens TaxID=261697 RepID=A0AAN7B3K8_9PEZI|nr:hypothetical protein QBC37DRAFT_66151 [Rhypophila decipiens]
MRHEGIGWMEKGEKQLELVKWAVDRKRCRRGRQGSTSGKVGMVEGTGGTLSRRKMVMSRGAIGCESATEVGYSRCLSNGSSRSSELLVGWLMLRQYVNLISLLLRPENHMRTQIHWSMAMDQREQSHRLQCHYIANMTISNYKPLDGYGKHHSGWDTPFLLNWSDTRSRPCKDIFTLPRPAEMAGRTALEMRKETHSCCCNSK